ncbi:MAG: aminotransferase class I/II-fold pyridoxal phosphate-dependent enzyme [Christensenellaceae bacterium]|nr:aminotransferase class I/II-fold pyridoxal phosphate-dependent enzyme [Christensenellaceae bacterium]
MRFSKLTEGLQMNIFNVLDEKRQKRIADGGEVYNMFVGTPDLEPPEHVVAAVREKAEDPGSYKYTLGDIPELTEAVIAWYERRFGVSLEKDEVTSVNGTQEGIGHISLAMCDQGDKVMVPDPGYPIFSFGALMAGSELVRIPMKEENGYIIDLEAISPTVAHDTKLMIVSYPSNPVAALAQQDFYDRLVAFAKRYDIMVVHDNAYCELVYDGREGTSFLKSKGAKEVGIEFNSLSKSYNMTGMRVSFALGNRDMIARFRSLRSQIDYGMYLPLQYGAIAAISGPQDILDSNRAAYQRRRDALCDGFDAAGWHIRRPEGTMFAWARIPDSYDDSFEFVYDLIDRTGLICTPGSAFGPEGEGYVRFALVLPEAKIKEMIRAVDDSGILR